MGLVGESGAGKTTIARMLLGFIEPEEGRAVLYDSYGVQQCTGPGARDQVAYVPQGNSLFSGSIRENLRIGSPEASDREMLLALDAAEAGFVRLLPDGLDTVLLEHGGAVSEGQAQRIAIARALLRKKPLIILDEATSALDLKTERAIMHNLRTSAENTTLLVISHRPTLLGLCDRCCLLDCGALKPENDIQKEWVIENGL
jgi:ABC-type bacteriocin/lantibiotic exporter with double-glycine peptidase domain